MGGENFFCQFNGLWLYFKVLGFLTFVAGLTCERARGALLIRRSEASKSPKRRAFCAAEPWSSGSQRGHEVKISMSCVNFRLNYRYTSFGIKKVRKKSRNTERSNQDDVAVTNTSKNRGSRIADECDNNNKHLRLRRRNGSNYAHIHTFRNNADPKIQMLTAN